MGPSNLCQPPKRVNSPAPSSTELSGVTATGKGVIVGIIDTGIDWRHPDFRNPTDSLRSRILGYLGLWSLRGERGRTSPRIGFDYGREWNA